MPVLDSAPILPGVDGRRLLGRGWLGRVGWPKHRRQSVLLTQDVEEFGALQKPREAKGEHCDRFANKHGVVVVRPSCGERDTSDNGDPDDDGAAPMDGPPRGTPAHRTILTLSVAIAEAEADYAEQGE